MSDLFSVAGKTAVVTGGSPGDRPDDRPGLRRGRRQGLHLVAQGRRVRAGGGRAVAGRGVRRRCPPTCRPRPSAAASPTRWPSGRTASTSSSTTPAPPGARRWSEFDDAAWDRVLTLNVKGVFHLTKFLHAAAGEGGHCRRPGPGHQHRLDRRHPRARAGDVLVLDVQGRGAPAHPAPGPPAGPEHITVNAIAPGPFESKMMAATLDAFGDQIAASAPLRRIGAPTTWPAPPSSWRRGPAPT